MPQVLYVLFGALLTLAACQACGRLLLSRFDVPFYRQERWAFEFILGSAVLSMAVFTMAALHVVYKGTILAVGLALIAWAWRLPGPRDPALPALPRWVWWTLTVPLAVNLAYAFFFAMAPENSPDGIAYHLGLVHRYYRARGFTPVVTNMYSGLTMGAEMLFLFAFGFGRHSGAALTHFAFLPVLGWLMACYGRRFGFPVAGAIGSVFVMVSPVAAVDAASAYNDVAAATVMFACFYLLQIWDSTRTIAIVPLIGVLAGFAFGIKYTAVPAAMVATAWLVVRRAGWKPLARFAAGAAIMTAPWLVKNTVYLANPVAPFYNRWFPNPNFRISSEADYKAFLSHYGVERKTDIPLELTVSGYKLNGVVGPLYLLAPVALAALRAPHGRRLLLAALLFAVPYAANVGTRFLIPALPLLSLAMAAALASWPRLLALLAVGHAISACPPVLSLYCHQYAWRLDDLHFRAALRIQSEYEFLSGRSPSYLTARLLEERTPPGASVLATNAGGEAYTSRDMIVTHQSARGQMLGTFLYIPVVPDWLGLRRLDFRFPPVRTRAVRALQRKAHANDQWHVSEFRLYNEGAELPRESGWRLRAAPNPWDVQEAFDGSILTGWRSWEPMREGMFVEVRFPEERLVDGVAIDTLPVEHFSDVIIEVQDRAGVWRQAGGAPRKYDTGIPFGLRRACAAILKERGITHVLLHERDYMADDVERKTAAWNLMKLGEAAGFRLYAIR